MEELRIVPEGSASVVSLVSGKHRVNNVLHIHTNKYCVHIMYYIFILLYTTNKYCVHVMYYTM